MNILLLGGSGKVGTAIQHVAGPDDTIIAPGRKDVDLSKGTCLNAINRMLKHDDIDAVINCAIVPAEAHVPGIEMVGIHTIRPVDI